MSQIINKISIFEYLVITDDGNIYRVKGDGDKGTIKIYKKNGKRALYTCKYPGYVKGEPGHWKILKDLFDGICQAVEEVLKCGVSPDEMPDRCAEEGWI